MAASVEQLKNAIENTNSNIVSVATNTNSNIVSVASNLQNQIDLLETNILNKMNKYWDSTTLSYIETKTPSVEQIDTNILFEDLLGINDITTIDKTPHTADYPAMNSDYLNYYYWQLNNPSKSTLQKIQLDLFNIESKLKTDFSFEGIESSPIKYGIFNYSIEADEYGKDIFSVTLIYVSRISLGVSFEKMVEAHINTTDLGKPRFEIKNKTGIIIGTTQGPRGGSANLTKVNYSEFNENESFIMLPRIFNIILPKSTDKTIIKEAINQHIAWANLTHSWYNQGIYKAKGLSIRPTAIIDFFDFSTEITIDNTEYLLVSLVELYSGVQGLVGHIAMSQYGLNEFSKKWTFDRSIAVSEFESSIPKVFSLVPISVNDETRIVNVLFSGIGSLLVKQEIIQQYNYVVTKKFVDYWANYYKQVIDKYYSIDTANDFALPPSKQELNKSIDNKISFWLSTFYSELSITTIFDDIIGPHKFTKDKLLSLGYIILI